MFYSIQHHQYDDSDQRHSHHNDTHHHRSLRHHHSQKDLMSDFNDNTSNTNRSSSNHRSLQNLYYEKDSLIDSSENTNFTSRSSRSCFSSSTNNNSSISNSNSMRQSIQSMKQTIMKDNVRPYDSYHNYPISSLQSPRSYIDENINRSLQGVRGTLDNGSSRAIYIKTGNSLYNDIEYYEYTMPISSSSMSSSSLQQLPPRTPKASRKNQAMSEFARSAYLTASPI